MLFNCTNNKLCSPSDSGQVLSDGQDGALSARVVLNDFTFIPTTGYEWDVHSVSQIVADILRCELQSQFVSDICRIYKPLSTV